ncbi:MAG: NADH-quinone oxidoreductase subunit M [Alphaproteobacteria bacterium]|nr:NADH-quinone oxidoreductase subunit M [Alphaproteobacteria bacterium]
MVLISILSIPIIAIVFILFQQSKQGVKHVALFFAILQLLCLSYGIYEYQGLNSILYDEFQKNLIPNLGISIHTGINSIGFLMLCLTSIITISSILVSWSFDDKPKLYFMQFFILNLSAFGFFTNFNLFVLFLFLELAVVPKFLLIYIWGSGKNKFYSMMLLISLMLGSVLILGGIIFLSLQHQTIIPDFLDITKFRQLGLPYLNQKIIFFLLFFGFSVFGALFPFHFWVPGAHGSAPTAGSMFLAGVSMKLGSYGCFLVVYFMFPNVALEYKHFFIILALITIIYGAILTLQQNDLKFLNAYSSISHCGLITLGLFLFNSYGLLGSFYQLISHGLMSGLMFAVIGMIYYRTHTKNLKRLGGLLQNIPFISTLFILGGLCSLGMPGFSSFVAEFLVLFGTWLADNNSFFYKMATLIAALTLIFSALYIIKIFNKTVFGALPIKFNEVHDAYWYEKLAGSLLSFLLIILGLAPQLIFNFMEKDVILFLNKL